MKIFPSIGIPGICSYDVKLNYLYKYINKRVKY